MVANAVEKVTGAENIIWDLGIFYSSPDDPKLTSDMESLTQQVEAFAQQYKGKVAQFDAETMMDALNELEAIYDQEGRIGSYASLLYATDSNNPQFGALVQKITEFGSQLDQKMVFFDLEWNNTDDAVAQKLMDDPTLAKYRHMLEAERRYKPYQLSEVEEQLLTEKAVTGRNAWTRFFTQLMGAIRVDWEGAKVPMTPVFGKLHEPDREIRQKAAEAITASLHEKSMELTYIFNVLAADKASNDKLRGYPSWISSRNLANKAPDEVVDALIQAVTSNYDIVARHYELKRRLLGLDELKDYDRYAPLPIKEADTFYEWDQARGIVLNAFNAFSPRVSQIAQRFFDENWIHAPVTPGKRGGAFCNSTVPSAHPFVLVNFEGKDRDVMTLAHELGHGVHGYLAAEAQGVLGMHTPLTTAEMASTFGEMLVFTDLMQREPDAEARLAMLAHKIEDSFATIFRQVSMNRFEDGMHNARRTEGELTTERVKTIAQRFFDESWIHAPVTPGKRGGYCSNAVPSAHPFVLVNYEGKDRDVMTLAHELGHGVHGYLAAEAQGVLGMHTPLTTAEMASTFGEMLVFTDLMQREPDAEARLAMLAHAIEDSFATVSVRFQ